MSQLTKILQAFLFTLLLGLSPLQGAIASFVDSSDLQKLTHLMADASDSSMVVSFADAMTPNCGRCNNADTCLSHSCSSDQCASCALALPPVASLLQDTTATLALLRAGDGIIKQYSIPLFRPPKI